MIRTVALALLLASSAAFAADPAPDTKALGKAIAASLRDVHDRGADLYNLSKDYAGAHRLYEGALLAVKPLLAHRADVQKSVDDSLAAATKETDAARKAFLLHEAIEKVRGDLKTTAATPKVEPMPMPMKPKDPQPMPVKPKDPTPMPPVKPKETAPAPKAKDTKVAIVSGKVTVQGKPLAEGTVTFVLLGDQEKLASAVVKNGAFTVKDLLPGKYAVAVVGKPAASVPAKFGSEETSGLTYTAQAGTNEFNIELK